MINIVANFDCVY